MSISEILREAANLSSEEKDILVVEIAELFPERLALIDPVIQAEDSDAKLRNRELSEFEGIGASLYDGTDAQEHVNQLRPEWDHRP